MEAKIERATELIQPITYQPFEHGFYVLKNGVDMGNSDYCEKCIGVEVNKERERHRNERKRIIEKFAKISADGFYHNKKKKIKVTDKEISRAKRHQLKQYPAKAHFTYAWHDPDFGGGLSEPCCCAECGEPFQCSFTPDLGEATKLLEYINDGDLSDRMKWECDIAFYHFSYCKDGVKNILLEVADKIIELLTKS